MANGFPAFDAAWQPPGNPQISQNGHGKQISFGVSSSRKPLPLSLFGDRDDDDEEQEESADGKEEEEEEFGEFESVSTYIANESGNGAERAVEQALDSSFGEFETQQSPATATATTTMTSSAFSNGWAFTTPTSELMLAMHGIRSDHHHHSGIKPEEVSFSRFANLAADESFAVVPEANSDDEFGEFVEPSVSREEVGGAKPDVAKPPVDMIDLISLSEDDTVALERSETAVETTPTDFFWDSSDLGIPVDVRPLSLQEVAVEKNLDTSDFAGVDWEFAGPPTKLGNGGGFSRSVSLPVAKFSGDLLLDSMPEPASHRQSQSSGTFSFFPDFAAIDEPSSFGDISTSNGPVTGTEKAAARDVFESFWDAAPNPSLEKPETTSNDLIDLLSLDWDSKAVLDAPAAPAAYTPPSEIPDEAQLVASTPPAGSQSWKTNPTPYLRAWTRLARACATELKLGLGLWHQAQSRGCSTQLVSDEQGENYLTALLQIYRVSLILGTTQELYASRQCEELELAMDESRRAWKGGLENAVELLDSKSALLESVRRLEESLRRLASNSVGDIVGSSSPHCALSLLALDSLPDVPFVVWGDKTYFLPVANLWANRVSRSFPLDEQSGILDV